MARVGYARVSSVGQSLEVQLDKLKHCDKIYQEKKSGASSKRPRLKACLEYIREGDTLVVTRLDRLARSTLHLCQIAADLERKQVNLQVLDQNINTTMMQQVAYCSTCWAQSLNSRPRSAQSGKWMAFRRLRNEVCTLVVKRT